MHPAGTTPLQLASTSAHCCTRRVGVVTAAPLAVHRSNGDRPGQAVPRLALRVVKPPSEFDLAAAEQAAAAFLGALGVDLDTEGLGATPARMARAYAELFTPRSFDLTTFGNDATYDELIIARSVPVHSVCEHHLLPFIGVAHCRLPTGGADSWPVEAGAGGRAVRTPAPGARTANPTTRRRAPRPRGAARRRCRPGSRTSMHDHAWRWSLWGHHRHLGAPRPASQRRRLPN